MEYNIEYNIEMLVWNDSKYLTLQFYPCNKIKQNLNLWVRTPGEHPL